ncbi:cytochrome p450 [Trichoderma arundinaceum]|uniref:Cytochrome p450 n=1 Tax=Trichoderma arundinaceum TaxID=490622 RepID=A0A395NNZ1_TRIAR|nr:cytochrome p450 [Trichoderma arundinaceum]
MAALFYLLGDHSSTAREFEIAELSDFDDLQDLVASHFSIVEPHSECLALKSGTRNGLTYIFATLGVGLISDNRHLTSVADVLAADGPIAISIDGSAVREIPGPKCLPYLGNYTQIYPDHLGNHQRLFDKYGGLFAVTSLGVKWHYTNDPNLANIFFTESEFFTKKVIPGHPLHPFNLENAGIFFGSTDSENWRITHKFLPPALGPKAVKHYAPKMQLTVEDAFKVFDQLDENEEAWNVFPYMLKLASQAITKLILGMNVQHFTSVDAPFDEMVIKIIELLELTKKVSAYGTWYGNLPFGDPKKLRNHLSRVRALLDQSIKEAKKGEEDLELQEAALQAENVVDFCIRARDNKGNKMNEDQVTLGLTAVTGAGFSTTAAMLSWLIYGLVFYDGMQERLLQELIDNDWDENTQVTPELTQKLTFLDKYVKETQRRHNSSFQPARTAKTDMILPGGYRMAKDSIVIIALHHIHTNSKHWDSPARFDPDRWDTEEVKNRVAGSYQPFGSGARSCIGFNLALQEVKIFLPKLLYRYKFTLAKVGETVEYDPNQVVIKPNNLYVRAERRVRWPAKSE